ncbi:MAG: aminotransferase class V-fold PLP-dependent enzyme [Spirosomataceae bacterium]
MFPTSFYPGPSTLYPIVENLLKDVYSSGILQQNHRSDAFMQLWKETKALLYEKLLIPAEYDIFITSSSTECWEIVNQSLLCNQVQFFYNGAFGKKWFKYAVTNRTATGFQAHLRGTRFFENQLIEETEINPTNQWMCIVQNETSNGTQISENSIRTIRQKAPHALVAVDATSSLGGQLWDWQVGDVWFSSVQKCLGLPAGMALLIVSPKAMEWAKKVDERNHYNSLLTLQQNFRKNQTHITPNVLGVYLLHGVLQHMNTLDIIDAQLQKRADNLYHIFTNNQTFKPLITNELTRSKTVICIEGKPEDIQQIKKRAQTHQFVLGNGYGEWKDNSFRIANFPAIASTSYDSLIKTLFS